MTAGYQSALDAAADDPRFAHVLGNVDDCYRCINCEVLASKAYGPCRALFGLDWVACWGCTTGRCVGDCLKGYVPRVVPR